MQKKCLVFSVGLHGLLTVILFASAGFSSTPPQSDLQIMTLIPANIVDRAGAGGGTPVVNLLPQPKAQPPSPPQPQPDPAPQTVQTEQVERVQIATPQRHKETVRPLPVPDNSKDVVMESKPRPTKVSTRHEIHVPDIAPYSAPSRRKSEKSTAADTASAARAEARRLKTIESSLADLASSVRTSGSPNTIVDVEGIGGGEAFAGYRDVVYSYYYRAWMRPEDASSKQVMAEVQVVIARDGSVISAELVRSSDDRIFDKSVERALRMVTKLPPFPASARDEQRAFKIRFTPDDKEASG